MEVTMQLNKEIEHLSENEKQSLLIFLKKMATLKKDDSQKTADFILQYNNEIDEAVASVKAGNYVTHEDVVKESASW